MGNVEGKDLVLNKDNKLKALNLGLVEKVDDKFVKVMSKK